MKTGIFAKIWAGSVILHGLTEIEAKDSIRFLKRQFLL